MTKIKIDPEATIFSAFSRQTYKAKDVLNSLEQEATLVANVYHFEVTTKEDITSKLMVNWHFAKELKD